MSGSKETMKLIAAGLAVTRNPALTSMVKRQYRKEKEDNLSKRIEVITKVMNDTAFTCKELTIAFKGVATNTKLIDREVIKYGKERSKEKSKSSCRYSSGGQE